MNATVALDLAHTVIDALRAAQALINRTRFQNVEWHGREPKITIDRDLDELMRSALINTDIPVLSEETEHQPNWYGCGPIWIVDPLDGSLNFARKTGPSVISIALWENRAPVFGAILDIASGEIAWADRGGIPRRSERAIQCSNVKDIHQAILCTGIATAFDWSHADEWTRFISRYGRIRMIGSAASSLLMVAEGRADAYFEKRIKIWDVAAGIALVEAAGGKWQLDNIDGVNVDLSVTNGHI